MLSSDVQISSLPFSLSHSQKGGKGCSLVLCYRQGSLFIHNNSVKNGCDEMSTPSLTWSHNNQSMTTKLAR
ncbi:Uncharacterized protein TCM_001810 [Theobroma cacao]|uniref:Uncharacterized protein n=1 Tax=Theobroma cacao TaxID=3641 RepID=A0A061DSI6_THECC|nr:Uncharacterized protein TCM_001810 [Theobroma cacao]